MSITLGEADCEAVPRILDNALLPVLSSWVLLLSQTGVEVVQKWIIAEKTKKGKEEDEKVGETIKKTSNVTNKVQVAIDFSLIISNIFAHPNVNRSYHRWSAWFSEINIE